MLPENDDRDPQCGLVLINQMLERGVCRGNVDQDTDSEGSQMYHKYMEEMDLNNDGHVSREEFLAFIEQQFAAKG